MKKRILNSCIAFCLIIFYVSLSFGQQKQPASVLGLEYGYSLFKHKHYKYERPTHSLGLSIEFPFEKFSISSAILYQSGKLETNTFTGRNFIEENNNGEEITMYEFDRNNYRLHYVSVPLKLQWRLPCNCIYLYGGAQLNYLAKDRINQGMSHSYKSTQTPEEVKSFTTRDLNTELEFGFGFKLHQSDWLRYFIRPSYNVILNPVNEVEGLDYNGFKGIMRIAFGVQFASAK